MPRRCRTRHSPKTAPSTAASGASGATPAPAAGSRARSRARSVAAAAVMLVAVFAVYLPLKSQPDNNTLLAHDYHHLHARRIQYVQQAIAEQGTLPGWYSRELMGSPFRANIQNFPFIPTRLLLLPLDTLDAPAVGVQVAALLAAMFTFCFARQIGLSPVAAAAAGWTFACAGFFAARVTAGHLPLLEAYPALPLLLWRVEACFRDPNANGRRRRRAVRLGVLALCTLCVVLAGHPQLPLYACVIAALYAVYRGWRRRRDAAQTLTAMALGAAAAAFSLWPMLELIGRSTRVLALADAENDVIFPYRRLIALILPWRDGWPDVPLNDFDKPFTGYPNEAYFWETVCYVGWVPLLATMFLGVRFLIDRPRRWRADPPWGFFAVVGVVALLTALPAVQHLVEKLPGTILRSPSRQVYITTFALALATGLAIDVLLRTRTSAAMRIAPVVLVLLIHAIDLGRHDRAFIRMITVPTAGDPRFEQFVREPLGPGGRIAIDYTIAAPFNRRIDDIGFFDSIMLAGPYAALLDLAGAPPDYNTQDLNGSDLPPRALAATGVKVMMTYAERPDLPLRWGDQFLRIYEVPRALPRAQFLAASRALPLDKSETHRRLRDPAYDVGAAVMLPPGTTVSTAAPVTTMPTTSPTTSPTSVTYERPSSDVIVLHVNAAEHGFVRVLESWDPGWRATVGGADAEVLCADDVFLAVALPPGQHTVRLAYTTPGAATGIIISVVSLLLLAALLLLATGRCCVDASNAN